MRALFILVVLVCMSSAWAAGPAYPEGGAVTNHRLALDPSRGLDCIQANLLKAGTWHLMRYVAGSIAGAPRSTRLNVSLVGKPDVVAIVSLDPEHAGSVATVWWRVDPVYKRQQLLPAMLRGC